MTTHPHTTITHGQLVHHRLDHQDAVVRAIDWHGPDGRAWVELAWVDSRGRLTGQVTWAALSHVAKRS